MASKGLLYVCDDLGNWIACVQSLNSIPDIDAEDLQGGELLQYNGTTRKWEIAFMPGELHNPTSIWNTPSNNPIWLYISDQEIRAELRYDQINPEDFRAPGITGGYVLTAGGDGYIYWMPSSGSDGSNHNPVTIQDTATIDLALSDQQISANLKDTTVTPGSYSNASITVDAQGRLTFAASGTSGSGGGDTTAFHSDIAGEIHVLTEKTTPVAADEILIEDSADSYSKKRVQISNLGVSGEVPAALRVYLNSAFR